MARHAAAAALVSVLLVLWSSDVVAAPATIATNLKVAGRNDLGGAGLNGPISIVGKTAVVGSGVVANAPTHPDPASYAECFAATVKVVQLASPKRPTVAATIPLAAGVAAIGVATLAVATPSFNGDLAAVALDDGESH